MGWQNRDDNGMTLCHRGTLIWIAVLKKFCWTKRFLYQNLKGECEVPRWGMWRGDNRLAGQVIDLLCVWCWYWGLPEFWFDPDWVVMSFHEMVNLGGLENLKKKKWLHFRNVKFQMRLVQPKGDFQSWVQNSEAESFSRYTFPLSTQHL